MNLSKEVLVSSIAALALLLPAGAFAQSSSGQSIRQQSKEGGQRGSRFGQQQTVSGQIEGFRHFRSGRGQGAHSLIRLNLDDGRTLIIDAGPKRKLDQFRLQQGDRLQAQGRLVTTAGGSRTLVADRLRIDGTTVTVQRRDAQQRRGTFAGRSTQRQTGRPVSLSGSVEGFRHIRVRNNQGQRQTHTLAKIQLENGRTTFVDLGPKQRLDRLNLQKGETIRVQAQPGAIDGRHILFVDRMHLADRQQRQTGQQKPITLQGTVRGYQIMSIGSGNQQQLLLRLQLQDGRSVLINAGEYQPGELNLRKLDLNDQVTIKARRARSGNSQFLIADSIAFEESVGGASSQPQTGVESKRSKQ